MTKPVDQLTESQLLDLFTDHPSLFTSKQGHAYRDRLKTLISETRSSCGHDAKQRLTQVFRLILSCPFLLTKPEGFEWVPEEFIDALVANRLSARLGLRSYKHEGIYHHVDMKIFHEAWQKAWGQLNRGQPKKPLTHYSIAKDVEDLMVRQGLELPHAVQMVASERSRDRKDGVVLEDTTVYRSLREVGERERTRFEAEEVYFGRVGLIKPMNIDVRSAKEKKAREEMLKKRSRGFPSRKKPKKKG
jgi:hypothetical protein